LDIREPEVWNDTTGGALEFHTLIWLLSSSVLRRLNQIAIYKGSGPSDHYDRDMIGCGLENIYTGSILPQGHTKPRDIQMICEVATRITGSDARYLIYIVGYIKKHHAELIRPGTKSQCISTILGRIRGGEYRGPIFQTSSRHNLIVEDTFDGRPHEHKRLNSVPEGLTKLKNLLLSCGGGNRRRHFTNYNTLLSILLPAIYGGIHLAARNAAHPTMEEHHMWMYACVVIMTSLPAIMLVYFFVRPFLEFYETVKKNGGGNGWFWCIFVTVGSCLALAGVLLLFLARCFIIVESFISLRTAPIGIYWTPAWIQTFPHV
jgi:hypothetical protein